MSITDSLTAQYHDEIRELQNLLKAPVKITDSRADQDYGPLPGPPARHVLRAHLEGGLVLSLYNHHLQAGTAAATGDGDAWWEAIACWHDHTGAHHQHCGRSATDITAAAQTALSQ